MADESFRDLITSIRTRVQAELDSRLPELAARHDREVQAARETAQREAEQRWSGILEDQKARATRELESAVAAARSHGPDPEALLEALRAMDSAATASDLLTAVATACAAQSSRAALHVGPELEVWNGAPDNSAATPMRQAMATGRSIRKENGGTVVPLMLDGVSVAVLDADPPARSEGWVETIDLIARYGAAKLAALTAVKTAQAQRWIHSAATGSSLRPSEQQPDSGGDAVQSARRYARLLVSEIKLYNEAAVHEGRAHRDLGRRLASEIERARRTYEERVPSTVVDRGAYFQQELIQTLAGGDPALLG